jgi:hypothetical protein
MFSKASRTENRGSTPRNTASSPVPMWRSTSSTGLRERRPERRRGVHGQRRCSHSTFGTDERKHLPCRFRRRARQHAPYGFIERFGRHRFGHALGYAHSHALEHEAGIQRREDEHRSRVRVLATKGSQRHGQVIVSTDVEDQHLRRRGGA